VNVALSIVASPRFTDVNMTLVSSYGETRIKTELFFTDKDTAAQQQQQQLRDVFHHSNSSNSRRKMSFAKG